MNFFIKLDKLVGGNQRKINPLPGPPVVPLQKAVALTYLMIRPGGVDAILEAGTYSTADDVKKAAIRRLNQLIHGFGKKLKTPNVVEAHRRKGDWKEAACARIGECPSVRLGSKEVWNIVQPIPVIDVKRRFDEQIPTLSPADTMPCDEDVVGDSALDVKNGPPEGHNAPIAVSLEEEWSACDPAAGDEWSEGGFDRFVVALKMADVAADIACLLKPERKRLKTVIIKARSTRIIETDPNWADRPAIEDS